MDKKTFVSMKAVIFNDKDELLILQESSQDPTRSHVGKWDVPGGRLDFGEDPIEGLKREVREETGLEIEIDSPLDVSHWTPKKGNEDWYIVALFMRCKAKTSAVKIDNFENQHFKWIKKTERDNFNIIPSTKKALVNL